jgi:hypothetical protein
MMRSYQYSKESIMMNIIRLQILVTSFCEISEEDNLKNI